MSADPLGLGRYLEPGELVVRVLGSTIRVEADRIERGGRRLDDLMARAIEDGEHLWTVIVAYAVTDLDKSLAGEGLLDSENLLYAGMGCYVYESPYTDDLRRRRCPGEPS